MMTSCDDQVKAYIKKIMSQLSRWMQKAKISKLVIVITSKETGEHVERWQFDVRSAHSYPTSKLTDAKVNVFQDPSKQTHTTTTVDKENSAPQQPSPDSAKSDDDVEKEIQALFR